MRKNQIILDSEKDLNIRAGTILSIYRKINRATVQLDDGPILNKIEFYYHCSPDNVEDGSSAFHIEDEVLVANSDNVDFIIGFKDLKPRSCISPRFFVKVKKEGNFEYYWLNLLKEGEYEITVTEAIGAGILEKMLETPYNNKHTQTKAFMLDTEDGEGTERWVAAPQLLTKDRIQQFLPLHYPSTEEPPESAIYPTPELCGIPPEHGLLHYCPPNRFFCNTEQKIMTWFTVKENSCICGIILNLEKDTVQSFIVESSDMNGEGFEPYWCVDRTNQEVPVTTIIDVIKLTQTELEIIIPWEMRPTKVKISLVSGHTEYEEINSCDHYYWSDDGFEKKSHASLTQSSENHSGSDEFSVTRSDPNCSPHTTYDDCIADDNHLVETLGKRTINDISDISKNHSEYSINIFGVSYSTNSDADKYSVNEALKEILTGCIWTGSSCISWGGAFSLLDVYQNRNISGHLYQKNMHTGLLDWICPNVLKIQTEYIKNYCDGEAEQRRNRVESMTPTAFEDMCYWGLAWPQSWLDLFTVGKCFQAGNMPGNIWNQTDIEQFYGDASWKVWYKETNQNEVTSSEIHKYNVDGTIEIDSSKYGRIYYLDDRSTDGSHGIIVAAKDYTKATESTPEYVHDWEIHWAKSETGYSDITADVLAALDCTKEQLYDIGLI